MNYHKAKKHTDKKRLDFLERNELYIDNNTFFTVLTQHVSRNTITLRDFCDFGIELERMYIANKTTRGDVIYKGFFSRLLESKMGEVWFSEYRPLNNMELTAIENAVDAEEDVLKSIRENMNKEWLDTLTKDLKPEEQHVDEQK
jgi:hypothetical protein